MIILEKTSIERIGLNDIFPATRVTGFWIFKKKADGWAMVPSGNTWGNPKTIYWSDDLEVVRSIAKQFSNAKGGEMVDMGNATIELLN